MEDSKGAVLPYRTTGEELSRLVEARARGRDLGQIQSLNFAAGAFQGTLLAASELGLVHGEERELTPVGREFALASPEEKRTLLLPALLGYPPYELLLEAVFDRGDPQETTLEWVQTWWSTQGYGNSQTNREEGSSALAKLLDFTGLGSYVQGRRGHPTRVRWREGIRTTVREILGSEAPSGIPAAPESAAPDELAAEAGDLDPPPISTADPLSRRPARGANSELVLNLGSGRTVQLSIPPDLDAAEKQKVIAMMELMISAHPARAAGSAPGGAV